MSFTFQWPRFSEQFHTDAIQMLNNALNKGNKPPVIADKIEVVELEMGTQPPELEIRDIGNLTMDQFRGIFRLTYTGDAHIVLKTKVQANPLNHKQPDIHLMTGSRGMLAAKEPLVVPMLLRLSHFKLSSYVVLVVSKQKGITLVFKTDPLQNVDINSTFDSIAVIQKFIQREIEGQLRQMFREDLPGIIHRLSQQWVKAKVEAPYLNKRSPLVAHRPFDVASTQDLSHLPDGLVGAGMALHQPFLHPSSLGSLSYGRARSISGVSVASPKTSKSTKSTPHAPTSPPSTEATSSIPELENFDPTYGLRPEGLPTKSVFSSFARLFKQNRGLADLTEEESSETDEDEEQGSFSVVDWDDSVPDCSPPASVSKKEEEESVTEYETIPAIGGGTITRPRVYHSLSMIQPPSEISRRSSEAVSMASPTADLRHRISQTQQAGPSRINSFPNTSSRIPVSHRPTSSYNPYFPDTLAYSQNERQRTRSEPAFDIAQSSSRPGPRPVTPDSLETQFSRSSSGGLAHSIETPPTTEPPHSIHGFDGLAKPLPLSYRRLSVSSSNLDTFRSGSPPPHHAMSEADPKIVLRASFNNTIHQLSTLSHSNHTLSPYTRSLEHFTVRSVPPRTLNAPGMHPPPERRPVKAKRKRTYRLGGTSKPAEPARPPPPTSPPSPVPPSEFDQSDIDQYFRSRDDLSVIDQQHPNSPPPSPLVRPRGLYDVSRRRAY
ncbi:hypothetical protein PAXRUDRAFT_11794 [Paxillus rubicundulus Ve08.2h10]|uniref:Mitochondrial distribution and morphology protein 34 n=1 Tax=Paxillus rubicundulus Ve08.2h10 TaxID=930991 RepID=A0A0D0E8D2_9AGAM|nr:hypothetical protein PAXRUDRAFT_11794 [Paxillus rubicundulus Ve08.2h10]